MSIEATTCGGERRNSRAWPGPGRVYVHLIFAAVWLPALIFGRNSALVMSWATAATIPAALADGTTRKERAINAHRLVHKILAAITGVWMFRSTPSQTVGLIAVAVYAVLYVLSERAIRRHVKSFSS